MVCVCASVCVCVRVCACVMLIRGSGSRGEKQAGRGHAGAGGNLRGVLSPEAGAPGATRRVRLWTEPTSSACTWNVLAPPPSSPNVLPSAPASLRTIPSIHPSRARLTLRTDVLRARWLVPVSELPAVRSYARIAHYE
jgi:hypothetical protein